MKNLALPKGWASKLLPKFIGPYKVLRALPEELKRRQIHPCFHVSLLRPHHLNNDTLFSNRHTPEAYNFGAPNDTEWYVEEITAHRWVGRNIQFEVKWSLGDTTWEPLANCNDLAALDSYLSLMGVSDWRDL